MIASFPVRFRDHLCGYKSFEKDFENKKAIAQICNGFVDPVSAEPRRPICGPCWDPRLNDFSRAGNQQPSIFC